MSANIPNVRQVQGYCSLCIARCGTVATVTDGRFTRLDPDPTHPTGAAICAKGRAAPELVYHKDRLKRPLRRTRPKGDSDPGWEEISWDAALEQIAAAMRRIAEQHGPEAVAFSQSSPSTTAIADSAAFVIRLMNAFGTPNMVSALELCGWGRGLCDALRLRRRQRCDRKCVAARWQTLPNPAALSCGAIIPRLRALRMRPRRSRA